MQHTLETGVVCARLQTGCEGVDVRTHSCTADGRSYSEQIDHQSDLPGISRDAKTETGT